MSLYVRQLVKHFGGVHQLWGAGVGSAVLTWAGAELGSSVAWLRDYWRGALGVFVMAIMVLSPSGLLGLGQALGDLVARRGGKR